MTLCAAAMILLASQGWGVARECSIAKYATHAVSMGVSVVTDTGVLMHLFSHFVFFLCVSGDDPASPDRHLRCYCGHLAVH